MHGHEDPESKLSGNPPPAFFKALVPRFDFFRQAGKLLLALSIPCLLAYAWFFAPDALFPGLIDKAQPRAELPPQWFVAETAKSISTEDRLRYIREHPDLSVQVQAAILGQRICRGMSASDATMSWGAPRQKTVDDPAFGGHEQWFYSSFTCLHFDGGRVTSWQTAQ